MTYRDAYRIEERIRPLTSGEAQRVAADHARWLAGAETYAHRPAREFSVVGVLFVAMTVFGFVTGRIWLGVMGAVLAFATAFVVWKARLDARAQLATRRGPWSLPPGCDAWLARELAVFARSVVEASSGDEDYVSYLLFELPGGSWFFVEKPELPDASPSCAHAEVRIVALHPRGEIIGVEVAGDPIPRRASPVDWRPEDAWRRGRADGIVPESALPSDIVAACVGP